MADFIHIDKLLSNLALRYRVQDDVAEFIAPSFKVQKSSDKYTVYGKGSLRTYDSKISGRQEPNEIDVEVTSESYACEEYGLSKFVSDRSRMNADKPINMDQDAVRKLKDAFMIDRERRVYAIAGSSSVITQTSTPTNKWDNKTSGTPINDIRTAMTTIWNSQAGIAPNAIVVPGDVALKMVGTDEYRDYFKYDGTTNRDAQFNLVSGLRNLGLEPKMAGVFGGNTNEGGASDPGAEVIWNERVLVFLRQSNPNLETRTLMYSPYVRKNEVTRIEDKRKRGVYFDMYSDIDELLIDATAGYLFTDVLT